MKNIPDELKLVIEQARKAKVCAQTATKALHCLDLTTLSDKDTEEKIIALCQKSFIKKYGHTAAVCILPEFVKAAAQYTKPLVKVATVINFPGGDHVTNVLSHDVIHATHQNTGEAILSAIEDGAEEIDIVFDYKSFLKGNDLAAESSLLAANAVCWAKNNNRIPLKVIMETAAFDDFQQLFEACNLAIVCGANFLKTSSGFHPNGGATLEAAAVLAHAIKYNDLGGLKVSGGIKTVENCAQYMSIATQILGKEFIKPSKFRIGASGVYDDIIRVLEGKILSGTQKCINLSPESY